MSETAEPLTTDQLLAVLKNRDLHAEVKTHALEIYPNECCGIVTAKGYVKLTNVAPDARHTFDCTTELTPYLTAGEVIAFVHSHPDGPHAPSAFDMEQQQAMDVPWGLISTDHEGFVPLFFWGDMLPPPPLEGRPFRYGPSGTDGRGDCAALVRDWFWVNHQIRLPEFPREFKWWKKPGVSYHNNLLYADFIEADRQNPQPGDVFLARIGEHQANHAGVYVAPGQLLQHLENQLSKVDNAVHYMRFVYGWYRHKKLA